MKFRDYLKEAIAPSYKGDWDDNKALLDYMKKNKGKSIDKKYKDLKIGDIDTFEVDPSVGARGTEGQVVAYAGNDYALIYTKNKEMIEVRL